MVKVSQGTIDRQNPWLDCKKHQKALAKNKRGKYYVIRRWGLVFLAHCDSMV